MMSNELKVKFIRLLKEAIVYNEEFPNDLEIEETLNILQNYYKILYNPLSN